MQPIPENILSQFNAVLERKAVSATLRDYYRKWLRYYLDFRVKYPLPDAKSEQVRLFIEKMWSKCKSDASGPRRRSDHDDLHALRAEQDDQRSRKPAGFLGGMSACTVFLTVERI